jgi:hypothetical protein
MKRAWAALALAFLAVSYLLHDPALLMTYPDSKEYRLISRMPISDIGFWYAIRPPVLPLFLKLSPNNYEIISLQLWIYVACALALAAAVARWMQRPRMKLVAAAVTLIFTLVPHHFLWYRSISTESLSFSLLYLLLALATVLFHPPRRKVWQLVAWSGWLIAAALFVFTRDANGYLLVFLCAAAVVAAALARQRHALLQSAAALSLALILTTISGHQSTAGGRWKWPFVNLLGQRVLWRPDRVAFFADHGMPVNPRVMCFAGRWGQDCHDDLGGFGSWLDSDHKGLWARYLLSHPLENLAAPFLRYRYTILASDGHKGMFFYFHKPADWYYWFGRIWFESGLILLLLSLLFAAAVWRNWRPLLPALTLLLPVPPMLLFVYHADAAETMRHSVIPAALLRLALILGILIAYDWMSLAWRARTQAGNTSL